MRVEICTLSGAQDGSQPLKSNFLSAKTLSRSGFTFSIRHHQPTLPIRSGDPFSSRRPTLCPFNYVNRLMQKQTYSRRSFLSRSVLGISGATLASQLDGLARAVDWTPKSLSPSQLKITDVKAGLIRNEHSLFVKIYTNQDIVGHGQAVDGVVHADPTGIGQCGVGVYLVSGPKDDK